MAAYGSNQGAFVSNTYVFDVSQISNLDIDPALKELLIRLYQNINSMNMVLNVKETGYYATQEFVNSQLWFPNPNSPANPKPYRPDFRYVVITGALPNTGTKSVPHGLAVNSNWIWTNIEGCATDPVNLLGTPLKDLNVGITVDATNVNITTTANLSSYTLSHVVLEYLKF